MFQPTTALQIDSSFQDLDESSADFFYSFELFFHPSDDITPDFLPMDYACIFGDQPTQSDWAKTLVRKGQKFAREDDDVLDDVLDDSGVLDESDINASILDSAPISYTPRVLDEPTYDLDGIFSLLSSGLSILSISDIFGVSSKTIQRKIKGKLKNLGSDRFPKWTRC